MDLKVEVPQAIDVWQDKVGTSFAGITKSSVLSFNQSAENFSSTFEQCQGVLYHSMEYSSREGEIRSLTVSA